MNVSDFDYKLPEELIAKYPSENRVESRLLVFNKNSKNISDEKFGDIENYFKTGDVLVLNNTKVMPARLIGKIGEKESEVLVVKVVDDFTIDVIGRPAKKMKIGTRFIVADGVEIEFVDIIKSKEGAIRRAKSDTPIYDILDKYGHMPLPPYIDRNDENKDRFDYQTVYADKIGAVAAPTAGLHFSEDLLEKLKNKGVIIVPITLHVGIGTFRPVKVENIKDHEMHYEYYDVSESAADTLNVAKRANRRIIACGTTSVRTLETVYDKEKKVFLSGKGETDIFIYPPIKVESIDALITNFHLPKSTLLMMIASFLDDNVDDDSSWKKIYTHAINKSYKFYSYGDAMFLY